jgi:hypothetical protein
VREKYLKAVPAAQAVCRETSASPMEAGPVTPKANVMNYLHDRKSRPSFITNSTARIAAKNCDGSFPGTCRSRAARHTN